jgi:hypothetical protein
MSSTHATLVETDSYGCQFIPLGTYAANASSTDFRLITDAEQQAKDLGDAEFHRQPTAITEASNLLAETLGDLARRLPADTLNRVAVWVRHLRTTHGIHEGDSCGVCERDRQDQADLIAQAQLGIPVV